MNRDSKLIFENYSKQVIISEAWNDNFDDWNWKAIAEIGKVLDPTGISSWKDAETALSEWNADRKNPTKLAIAVLNVYCAIPNLGILAAGWGGLGWAALRGAAKKAGSDPKLAIETAGAILKYIKYIPKLNSTMSSIFDRMVKKGIMDEAAKDEIMHVLTKGVIDNADHGTNLLNALGKAGYINFAKTAAYSPFKQGAGKFLFNTGGPVKSWAKGGLRTGKGITDYYDSDKLEKARGPLSDKNLPTLSKSAWLAAHPGKEFPFAVGDKVNYSETNQIIQIVEQESIDPKNFDPAKGKKEEINPKTFEPSKAEVISPSSTSSKDNWPSAQELPKVVGRPPGVERKKSAEKEPASTEVKSASDFKPSSLSSDNDFKPSSFSLDSDFKPSSLSSDNDFNMSVNPYTQDEFKTAPKGIEGNVSLQNKPDEFASAPKGFEPVSLTGEPKKDASTGNTTPEEAFKKYMGSTYSPDSSMDRAKLQVVKNALQSFKSQNGKDFDINNKEDLSKMQPIMNAAYGSKEYQSAKQINRSTSDTSKYMGAAKPAPKPTDLLPKTGVKGKEVSTHFVRISPGRYRPAVQADLASGQQLFIKNPNPVLRAVYPYVKAENAPIRRANL
jgi:hypothetical protein